MMNQGEGQVSVLPDVTAPINAPLAAKPEQTGV